ncbi:MAG: Lrp/AsnC family transcriptional regulator [Microthrixaceae bacterium]
MSRTPVDLDEIDRHIVAELQHDGRVSYADLGSRVGLSATAVRPRVQRLVDSGLVRVVGVTDPQALGYPVMAMLGIEVDGDPERVADELSMLDQVIYIVVTAGGFDLFVEVIAHDADALLHLVSRRVKAVKGVRRVESFLYFGIHTHRFEWGTP